MWSVKEFHHQMPISNQWRPEVVQEEEDKNSALVPTLPQVTSPPPSLPELDSESHHSLREALQGEQRASSV